MFRLSWTKTMVLALAKWISAKSFKDVSVIHGGMAVRDLDMAPALKWGKHHEKVGGPIALVLVIETGRAPRFHRDWHARFGNQLLRGLVQTKPMGDQGRVAACKRPARLPWPLRTHCWPSGG